MSLNPLSWFKKKQATKEEIESLLAKTNDDLSKFEEHFDRVKGAETRSQRGNPKDYDKVVKATEHVRQTIKTLIELNEISQRSPKEYKLRINKAIHALQHNIRVLSHKIINLQNMGVKETVFAKEIDDLGYDLKDIRRDERSFIKQI